MIYPSISIFDKELERYMVIVDLVSDGRLLIWTRPMSEKMAKKYIKYYNRLFYKSGVDVRCRLVDVESVYDAIKDLPSLPYEDPVLIL